MALFCCHEKDGKVTRVVSIIRTIFFILFDANHIHLAVGQNNDFSLLRNTFFLHQMTMLSTQDQTRVVSLALLLNKGKYFDVKNDIFARYFFRYNFFSYRFQLSTIILYQNHMARNCTMSPSLN